MKPIPFSSVWHLLHLEPRTPLHWTENNRNLHNHMKIALIKLILSDRDLLYILNVLSVLTSQFHYKLDMFVHNSEEKIKYKYDKYLEAEGVCVFTVNAALIDNL